MKIGVFDSGIGGLTILSEIEKVLPEYDYMYFADSKRVPYGEKSSDEIYEYTKQGLEYLFLRGAKLVIIACNTASAQALRRIQTEWLLTRWQDRKVLGVLIPIAEEVAKRQGLIGIMATVSTVKSGVYIKELQKINFGAQILQVASPLLVSLIEECVSKEGISETLKMYCLPLKLARIQSLILGCTHFPILLLEIQEFVGEDVYIPNTGGIVAEKLKLYLLRHQEIERLLNKNGMREFYTTGQGEKFRDLAKRFFNRDVEVKTVFVGWRF